MNKKSKNYILVIVLTIVVAWLVVYQIQSKFDFSIFNKKQEAIANEDENSISNKIKLSNEDERFLNTNPIGKKVKNNLKYPDKEKIHFKMFNAVDNFKTCKGEFIEERAKDNSHMKCTFVVDVKNKSSVSTCIEENQNITLIYHNDKRKVFNDIDKIYRESDEKQSKEKPTIVRPLRVFLNQDLTREDIGYLGRSRSIICGDAISAWLFIYEDWQYTESTFLGRDVYKLEGVIDENLSNVGKGKFSLIMDKKTGIILQFLSFDDKGKVKYKLECTSLELNTAIDESIYNKSTKGYMKK